MSPIKGRVNEKKHPLQKKPTVFSLTLQLLLTRSCAVDYFVSRPLFQFMVRVVFDPHQSPIWFKAIVFIDYNSAPSALADQKIVGAMPVPIVYLQIMWL
jgi:hypothetical protein